MNKRSRSAKKMPRSQQRDLVLGCAAIFTLIVAWLIGAFRQKASYLPLITQTIPGVHHVEEGDNGIYVLWGEAAEGQLLGYAAIGEANGYGGPMTVVVATSPDGEVLGTRIANHKETSSWIKKVVESDFMESLTGKSYDEPFILGKDIDGISGATYTSDAIAQAVLDGSQRIAGLQLSLELPEESPLPIRFGIPEITLVGLYIIGYFGHRRTFKFTKQARWICMVAGMIVLGFLYNRPLTLSQINRLLLGFMPAWQTNLYWYLLIGGVLFVFTIDNKNPYCEWFCPFGAVQECMGAIGEAKPRSVGKYKNLLLWTHRGVAWLAIILALVFRHPGLTSYEVFGTLFDLTGSTWQFAVLGIVLVASLFIHRPWCSYLCPLRPITDLYRVFRKWSIQSWRRIIKSANASARSQSSS